MPRCSQTTPPPEKFKDGYCWKLQRWLYKMRPATKAREEDYAERLRGEGMERGVTATTRPTAPHATGAVVHNDDFVIAGLRAQLDHFNQKMQEW